jgi:hypothetical protein
MRSALLWEITQRIVVIPYRRFGTNIGLDGQPSEFFLSGLQKLEQRAKNCIELRRVYTE